MIEVWGGIIPVENELFCWTKREEGKTLKTGIPRLKGSVVKLHAVLQLFNKSTLLKSSANILVKLLHLMSKSDSISERSLTPRFIRRGVLISDEIPLEHLCVGSNFSPPKNNRF